MRKILLGLAAFGLALGGPVAPVMAQSTSAIVVAACGTPPSTYPAGANRQLTQDTTGTLCSAGGGGGGGGAVFGPNAVGAAASHPPVIVGGTADATATGAVQVQKVDSSGNASVTSTVLSTAANQSSQLTQETATAAALGTTADAVCGTATGTCTLEALVKFLNNAASAALPAQAGHGVLIGAVEGSTASGVAVTDNPLLNGGRAATAAPTAVTDGQKVAQMMGAEGKSITLPYSIKELAVRGTVTSTDTAAHSIIASAGGSLKNYITNLECGRTDAGATGIVLTLSDSVSTVVILPSGGATNIKFDIPLVTAAATAFTVTSGTAVTTLYCSAQGYTGL